MITAPEIVWIAFNTLVTMATLNPKNKNRAAGFGLALGSSALSCALLSSGLLHLFLGMEIALWALMTLVVMLSLGVRPPGSDMTDVGRLAVSSAIRLSLALIVWLWV